MNLNLIKSYIDTSKEFLTKSHFDHDLEEDLLSVVDFLNDFLNNNLTDFDQMINKNFLLRNIDDVCALDQKIEDYISNEELFFHNNINENTIAMEKLIMGLKIIRYLSLTLKGIR